MIYDYFLSAMKEGKKLLAILLDPDKLNQELLNDLMLKVNDSAVNLILVGGSSVPKNTTDELVVNLRKKTSLPIVLFPGNFEQQMIFLCQTLIFIAYFRKESRILN